MTLPSSLVCKGKSRCLERDKRAKPGPSAAALRVKNEAGYPGRFDPGHLADLYRPNGWSIAKSAQTANTKGVKGPR